MTAAMPASVEVAGTRPAQLAEDIEEAHGVETIGMTVDVREPAGSGRVGQPEEVAALSLFRASEESQYITGEVHTVSGGLYYKA